MEEMAQGQKGIEEAQTRVERELEQSGELQIEDVGATEGFESPKLIREDQKGREEKLAGTQKTFQPPLPEQGSAKASQESAVGKATEDVSAAPAGSSDSQASAQQAFEASSSSQRALVPAVTEIVEAKDVKIEAGVSNGPHQAEIDLTRAQQVVRAPVAPASQSGISPVPPLFDDQQLHRFQEHSRTA